MLQSPIGTAAVAYRHGDIGYASLWVPDGERAAVFYAAVLGWEYAPQQEPGRLQVTGTTPAQGVWGGVSHGTLFCSYVVDDAAAAVALSPASEMGPAARHDLGTTWPGYVSIMVWLGRGRQPGVRRGAGGGGRSRLRR